MIYHGFVDASVTNIPDSSYGGIRDMMSYNANAKEAVIKFQYLGKPVLYILLLEGSIKKLWSRNGRFHSKLWRMHL